MRNRLERKAVRLAIGCDDQRNVPTIAVFSDTGDAASPVAGGPELRIALIDSRFLVRAAVSYFLEHNLCDVNRCGFHVRAFATPAEFMAECCEPGQYVDVIVLNIGSASLCDTEVETDIDYLRSKSKAIPLIVLSDRDECDCVQVLRQGVAGYIPTTVSWAIARQAIRLVHAGGTFLPAQALTQQVNDPRGEHPEQHHGNNNVFTAREREVLDLMRQGKPNKVIAHLLELSESTVKVYVRQIMKKVGARNRTHAIFLLSKSAGANGFDIG